MCACVCVCVCSSHSSLLKEPIPESLLCLCALGLVHEDATLASAALLELLKLDVALRGTVEEHCLLTCTLLALQGNYSAVQREASRAVFRYMVNLVALAFSSLSTNPDYDDGTISSLPPQILGRRS